jgi:glycosyltransferase 2 family protein
MVSAAGNRWSRAGLLRIGRLYVALGLTLSAVCLWIAFRQVQFADLASILRTADYRWLLFYPVLATALNVLRSEIWRLLLRRRVTVVEAFWAYATGFLVNNVLPLRMGEAARIGLLAARRRLPVVEVATAAGLERMLDLVFVVAILAASLPFAAGGVELRHGAMVVATTAALGVTVLMAVIVLGERIERRLARVLDAVLPRYAGALLRRWRELTSAVSVARDPAIAIPAIVGSLSVWTITIGLQWTVLRAFQPAAGLLEAALLVGIVSIAGAVPAAPGGIGTFQWVAQQALALPFPALYSPAAALAVALVSHAASYLYSCTLGAMGLWYFGVPFARLMSFRRQGAPFELTPPPLEPSGAAKD